MRAYWAAGTAVAVAAVDAETGTRWMCLEEAAAASAAGIGAGDEKAAQVHCKTQAAALVAAAVVGSGGTVAVETGAAGDADH